MKLKVNEIFYSLQGEGARAGSANIFIRLSGCKTQKACLALGVNCDTEFESGRNISLDELLAEIETYGCQNIIWTGGEPAQQLDDEIIKFFKARNFYQAIETSGLFPLSNGLDWITVSPKVAEHVIQRNFAKGVNELRYVRRSGQGIPQPSVKAQHYFISPHSDGEFINYENLEFCIELVKQNPKWKLSLQQHKIWKVR
ncbi:MAG TPA: 7-carboxy-7-deazaguanine synthase QueE [Pyrinomonadaceae bacterium]|nr:7-carboxy-7-deazaguanine synthase QueE [Pyrinomonadaceae bacterium]